VLEDLDFSDYIALLLSKLGDLHEKTGRFAAREGLKARKCKTPRTEFAHSRKSIVVSGEEVVDLRSLHTCNCRQRRQRQ